MKKLYLIKNPELFQGERYLGTNKNYFEGWYFKNTNNKQSISFIPGISINEHEKKAFIQVITNKESYFINYDISVFEYGFDPFYIKIDNNYFSKDNININIKDKEQNIYIHGKLKYSNGKNINTNIWSPNIMGPFSYIPFMECNHAILNMKVDIDGFININNSKIKFNNGIGYIEKDWGSSFPKTYIWCQGNNFKKSKASFMLSIADIPFKLFSFRGIICSLMIDSEEYRFATYNNAKLIKYKVDDKSINIKLKKGHYLLEVTSKNNDSLKLIAPIKGEMKKDILESISASIMVTLKKDNTIVFNDTSDNCGLEIVI